MSPLTHCCRPRSYWLGDAANDSLQRVYGMSFPDAKQLKEWQTLQEEAAKRDHRKIGVQQELVRPRVTLSRRCDAPL